MGNLTHAAGRLAVSKVSDVVLQKKQKSSGSCPFFLL